VRKTNWLNWLWAGRKKLQTALNFKEVIMNTSIQYQGLHSYTPNPISTEYHLDLLNDCFKATIINNDDIITRVVSSLYLALYVQLDEFLGRHIFKNITCIFHGEATSDEKKAFCDNKLPFCIEIGKLLGYETYETLIEPSPEIDLLLINELVVGQTLRSDKAVQVINHRCLKENC